MMYKMKTNHNMNNVKNKLAISGSTRFGINFEF